MSKYKQAPKFFEKTAKNGVPIRALVISMIFSMVGIISQFVAEDTVYLFIVYFIGGGNIFMYSVICICQYRFRKRFIAEGGNLNDLNYKVLSQATAIYVCAPCYLAIYIFSVFFTKKHNVKAANLDI